MRGALLLGREVGQTDCLVRYVLSPRAPAQVRFLIDTRFDFVLY